MLLYPADNLHALLDGEHMYRIWGDGCIFNLANGLVLLWLYLLLLELKKAAETFLRAAAFLQHFHNLHDHHSLLSVIQSAFSFRFLIVYRARFHKT